MTPPTIIMGMHRSGTTLLVELLQERGWFAGARMGLNREAFFFQARNEWLLRALGGSWDYPLPVKTLYENDIKTQQIADLFKTSVACFEFYSYTGSLKSIITCGSVLEGKPHWGWKDPRNVFTLGIWNTVFPGASLLYIRRNGVDVAASLRVREVAFRSSSFSERSYTPPRLLTRLANLGRPYGQYPTYSARCGTLDGCFGLWEEYSGEAESAFERYQGPKLCISYEDLVLNPSASLREITDFCGLDLCRTEAGDSLGGVVRKRAYAFLGDAELRAFYSEKRENEVMIKMGYGDI